MVNLSNLPVLFLTLDGKKRQIHCLMHDIEPSHTQQHKRVLSIESVLISHAPCTNITSAGHRIPLA